MLGVAEYLGDVEDLEASSAFSSVSLIIEQVADHKPIGGDEDQPGVLGLGEDLRTGEVIIGPIVMGELGFWGII